MDDSGPVVVFKSFKEGSTLREEMNVTKADALVFSKCESKSQINSEVDECEKITQPEINRSIGLGEMEKAAIMRISEATKPSVSFTSITAKADRSGFFTQCSEQFLTISGLGDAFQSSSIISLAKYTTPEELQQQAYMLDSLASSRYVAPEPGTDEVKWVAELNSMYLNVSYEITVTLSPTADTNPRETLDVQLKELSTSNRSSFFGSLSRHHSIKELVNLRILVVDDSLLVLKLVSRLIEGEGHIVDCKKDGLEALEALKNIEYDAVLMDIHMPEMGGLEASFEFRSHEGLMLQYRGEAQSNKLKIIAMSADSSEELLREVNRAGFDGFIPKPLTVEAFRGLKLRPSVFR